jgi:hypothetical protein
MQRIAKFLSHLLGLVVVLGLAGLLQAALAQNSDPVRDATHQGNLTTEPSSIAARPPAASPEQKATPPADSSALVIGPGDELSCARIRLLNLEITVYASLLLRPAIRT